MEKYIVALEFGSSKIACVAAQELDYGVRIATYREAESAGITKGEISNVMQAIDIANNLLRQTSKEIGARITNVIVGISGQYIKTIEATNERTRKDNGVLISRQEIDDLTDEMKRYKLGNDENIIHVLPQCYNIDDIMGATNPVGMLGDKIQAVYKLVVGRSRVEKYLTTALSMMEIKPDLIIFKGIASAYAVLTDDEKEVGVASVDIGGGTTDITIIHENVVKYCKTIPFGGNSITEDIRKAFGVSYKKAEQLKTQFGSCFSDLIPDNKSVEINTGNEIKQIKLKSIALVIEARMVEILQAVDYVIRESGLDSELSSGIVFTGGGATIMHLNNLAKHMFEHNCRIANPMSIMEDSCEDAFNQEASTVVGLALMGIESGICKECSTSVAEEQPVMEDDEEIREKKDEKKDSDSNIKVIDNKEERKSRRTGSFFGLRNVFNSIFDSSEENKEV